MGTRRTPAAAPLTHSPVLINACGVRGSVCGGVGAAVGLGCGGGTCLFYFLKQTAPRFPSPLRAAALPSPTRLHFFNIF